ncbi:MULTISPECIES: hypothetical protein [unclassified Variovorax]|uniref:hypothetical protein n=1 Tax=unclassified Variovorax TaxID=663243 RepID=UPI003F478558
MDIQELTLDLRNYRTVAQTKEVQAIQAMISVSPDRFWALVESLLDDGYLPTENIIVIKAVGTDAPKIVREGNRRIAGLKLIHGFLPKVGITVPSEIAKRIKVVTDEWKQDNLTVPCVIYESKEANVVDRIVTLTHGKGEKAAREEWKAIARARHNRDANQASEAGLDLLEKFFKVARNVSKEQSDNWAGTYPITVLDEAIKKLAPRLGVANAPELAKKYPKIDHRDALDAIIKDIGLQKIRFETIRNAKEEFAVSYGVPLSVEKASSGIDNTTGGAESGASNGSASGDGQQGTGAGSNGEGNTGSTGNSGGASSAGAAAGTGKKTAAVSINDPKSVMRTLRKFTPLGANREKVVTLKKEMLTLKLDKAPTAFCFLLRSMFEISAKAYCEDHKRSGGPSSKDASGKDKALVDVLRSIATHLTSNNTDKEAMKVLHGAMTQLGKPEGLLSVTSMNQLVHNPKFSVLPGDIAGLFGNIYPLLAAMSH